MSHTVTTKARFRDLDAVEAACNALGWKLLRGKTTHRWFGRWVGDYPLPEGVKREELGKCAHAIQVPGARYEIGLVETPEGYKPVWDFWKDGGLSQDAGDRLAAEYNVIHAEHVAQEQGWLTERDGSALLIHVPTSVAGFAGQGGTIRVEGKTVDATGFMGVGCKEAIDTLGLVYESVTAKPEFLATPVAVERTK